jgi:curved DNA-binding protein CbpA
MRFQYFKADHTTTIEDAKKQYYKLCMRWHPDVKGGDEEAMKQVNAEWDYLRKHNYNIHQSRDGGTYTDWTQDVPDDVTEQFADIISKLVTLAGLEIEICGSWLWVGGNTREHKADLKNLGMRWASKKKMWYKAPKNWKRKSRHELTMNEIRDRFGSQMVQGKQFAALTA